MNHSSRGDEVAGESEDSSGVDDPILARWAAEVADRLQAGEPSDLTAYTREHPERAEQLRRLLPAIAMMAKLGAVPTPVGSSVFGPEAGAEQGMRMLGEFRLIREVGKGGMGIVYEALEVPLGRRVALKVLPYAAALDPRQLKRFQHEAKAVASLNHRNIVPIYSVGQDRGIAYFAMQLIDGHTLAAVNRELRQLDKRDTLGKTMELSEATRSLWMTSHAGEPAAGNAPHASMPGSEVTDPRSEPKDPPSSLPPTRGRAFYRKVADLGRQAAEALAHVHELGIQHRDIKPANLLIDPRGHLWVTDFGLARLQNDCDQTRTGDLVGTVRYMSPEQAMARPGMIDHRTDIYSLGATLYELLTRRPAFEGDERQDLLMRIIQQKLVPPRRLEPTIPIDLETVVTKAMAREPSQRYTTAQDLADDLLRFLDGRPVLARRWTARDKVANWLQSHWPLVTTAAVLLLLFLGSWLAGLTWANARLRAAIARADQQQSLAERHHYTTAIRLAEQALVDGQIERAQDILEEIKPDPASSNPRRFAWHYLRRLATREIQLLRGHEETIFFLTISPDGRSLATIDKSHRVLLWDVASGRLRARLAGRSFVTGRPRFSPDSRLVMAIEGGPDSPTTQPQPTYPAIVLWDANTGNRIVRHEFHRRTGNYLQADFLQGGTVLATQWLESDEKVTVSLWDLAHDPAHPRLQFQLGGVDKAQFSPRGHRFATMEQGRIRIQAVANGIISQELPVTVREESQWDISPDGRLVIVSGPGQGVTIWDSETGSAVAKDPSRELASPFVFSADGQTMVAGEAAETGFVQIWDRRTGRWRRLHPDPSGKARTYHASLSADGKRLAIAGIQAGGGGAPVTLWDVPAQRLLETFPGRHGIYTVPAFAADGHSLYLACSIEVCRWLLGPPDRRPPLELAGHTDEAWAVAFSPDGTILASGSDDTDEPKRIKLWDRASGRLLRSWSGHSGTIAQLAFSPDGRSLASVALCNDDNVLIWDPTTGRLRTPLVGHTKAVRTVAYSPDGSLLATAGSDSAIRLWDPTTGRLKRLLSGHSQSVHQVVFAPDGRTLASVGDDQTTRLWDLATGEARNVLVGPHDNLALAFSPDGSVLATTGESGQIKLWEPSTGASLGKIPCDDGELQEIVFSPDGVLIAAAGKSQMIHLWDVATREELMILKGHQQQINGLTFAPDGMALASCSHDGAVKLWDARPATVDRVRPPR